MINGTNKCLLSIYPTVCLS